MRLAIMQPYFFPYIGYFQLIGSVDMFVVYDNIKYTKKGWINRNRMLRNGEDVTFTLPLKNAPDHFDIRDRELAPDFKREKLFAQFVGAYRHAPHYKHTQALLQEAILHEDNNLFGYLHHALLSTCRHLGITTPIVISSTFPIDHDLKGHDKVLALCEAVNASTYINAIGGQTLYTHESFQQHGIRLKFLKSKDFVYPQFGDAFVPWLSIVDVMMFNSLEVVASRVASHYDLI